MSDYEDLVWAARRAQQKRTERGWVWFNVAIALLLIADLVWGG